MATPPAPRSRSALAERLGAFGALLGLRDGETVVQVALGLAFVGSALVLWRDGATFAISRIERLYPNPVEEIKAEVAKYPNLKAIRWVQDEPRNMGPWPHYQLNVWPQLDRVVEPVTRPASASPSVGTVKRHVEEQKTLMDAAFEAPRDAGHDY